ncbi:Alpha/Beta hydrolase protein [Cantharellus anzutake]|uniref:Alpha/Beta hydrolase protein n=1 Tax=Cantharellus anzutake TaxID=1750568 RepID=UPI0019073836|nr:Alpha/Beta hydrolase protein [Cantharellus anzutake]KAF8329178.1 Alpha/Beta hydrolase protein [Cantharellus anzutake]
MPRVYTPGRPVYWKAYKRDPEDIVTNRWKKSLEESGVKEGEGERNVAEAEVRVKSKKREIETVSIRSFVLSRCPSLLKDYVPTWWLRAGHLNTIYCVVGDFTKKDLVEYERTLLRLPDGGTIGLDFTPPSYERPLDPKTPIVVVLHGLSGGTRYFCSFESYVRDILAAATAPKEKGGLGYRGVVMNFRGCAGVPLTTAQLYGGAHTEDIRSTILYLRQAYPEAPLLGVGFSLGANVLSMYVEEEGASCALSSVCVLGNPWNLNLNSDRLEKRFLYRNIYAKAMGGNLLFLLQGHLETLAKLAPTKATPHIQHLLTMRAPTLKDFDHHVTRFIGGTPPKYPFASADHYYAGSTTHKRTHEIMVPFLAFNTEDDPIVAENPIEEIERDGKFVCQVVTPYGGHLGWFEGGKGIASGLGLAKGGPPPRWVRKPVLEWLEATGEDVADLSGGGGVGVGEGAEGRGLKRKFKVVKNERGFTMLEGSDVVGYKLLVKVDKVKQPEPAGHSQAVGSVA